MNPFKVSVITPVYNAEKFLENAVNSALFHDCVNEVILIEDNSPDDALAICMALEEKHDRVKLYRHPNGENKGAGASRNLGIEKATCDYIAFLDADDWYEPNRFEAEKELLKNKPSIDGVYGATGFYYENKKEKDPTRLTSFSKYIEPPKLLDELIKPGGGRFTTDAITVKKSLLLKLGGFDTSLRLHQDSHLWLRLAYHGNLVTGIIDNPIAYRRVHDDNRITKANRKTAILYHRKVYDEFRTKNDIDKKTMRMIFKNVIINQTESNNNIIRGLIGIKEVISNPSLIRKII